LKCKISNSISFFSLFTLFFIQGGPKPKQNYTIKLSTSSSSSNLISKISNWYPSRTRLRDTPTNTRITSYISQSTDISICFTIWMINFHLPIHFNESSNAFNKTPSNSVSCWILLKTFNNNSVKKLLCLNKILSKLHSSFLREVWLTLSSLFMLKYRLKYVISVYTFTQFVYWSLHFFLFGIGPCTL